MKHWLITIQLEISILTERISTKRTVTGPADSPTELYLKFVKNEFKSKDKSVLIKAFTAASILYSEEITEKIHNEFETYSSVYNRSKNENNKQNSSEVPG